MRKLLTNSFSFIGCRAEIETCGEILIIDFGSYVKIFCCERDCYFFLRSLLKSIEFIIKWLKVWARTREHFYTNWKFFHCINWYHQKYFIHCHITTKFNGKLYKRSAHTDFILFHLFPPKYRKIYHIWYKLIINYSCDILKCFTIGIDRCRWCCFSLLRRPFFPGLFNYSGERVNVNTTIYGYSSLIHTERFFFG